MKYIIAIHIFAIIAHYLYEYLENTRFKFFGHILLVSKIFGYAAVIFHVHSGVSFDKYKEIADRS